MVLAFSSFHRLLLRLIRHLVPVLIFVLVIAGAIGGFYFFEKWRYLRTVVPPSHPSPNKYRITTIDRNFVYDLSGSEASGYSDPMKLFDEDCDPKNGRPGNPVTDPLPSRNPHLYFPEGKGLRLVIDLRVIHSITDIYLYDRSFESDSVWVYTGDMHHWVQQAAYKTGGTPHSWGWKNYTSPAKSRYLMIRFNSRKAAISEMVFYGTALEPMPLPPAAGVKAPVLVPPTLREFMGTNSYDFPPLRLMKPFYQTRLYQYLSWYDSDTVHAYPKNLLSLNFFRLPPPQQLRFYADSLKRLYGNHLWMSIRGVPRYLEKQGVGQKGKPVTLLSMNTEDPMSYARHAKTFWTLAAMFGNTPTDTSLLDVSDVKKFSGTRLMDRFENGNEEDAYWDNSYWTPVEYFAMSSADYDGHEGRMGARHGIKNADAASRLVMSGMIQTDTNRLKVLNFLCSSFRKDKKFIWDGGVQYHYYSNDATDNTRPPTRGISPEQDHMRKKLASVRNYQRSLLPGIPAILGENGYDRKQSSWQKTPLLPGYNEEQSQGIMIIRSMMAAFMSGFDGYNQFMLRNATNDENAPGTFATAGLIGGPANDTVYQAWYYWSSVAAQLSDYRPDAIISENGPVWIYKLRHKKATNKVAYYLVSPTTNGTVIKDFLLPVNGKFSGYQAFRLADRSVSGIINLKKANNQPIKIDVTECPVFVMLTEP